MTDPPSGAQFEISAGQQRATIVEVGGGVRTYTVGERDVLDPYPLDAMCDGAHGAPLIPWPNRLADGAYTFEGTDHQVALTEPDKNNAIHGFLRWRNWTAREYSADRVVMGTVLNPLKGYPFTLDVAVAYRVGEQGLIVRTTATNGGAGTCPYGAGQHPYLSPGHGVLDDCTLGCRPPPGSTPTTSGSCRPAHNPPPVPRWTSPPAGRWATNSWISRSPTWPATPRAGRGCGSPALTGAASSCGSTSPTRSSSCTPGTPWPRTAAGGGWAANP